MYYASSGQAVTSGRRRPEGRKRKPLAGDGSDEPEGHTRAVHIACVVSKQVERQKRSQPGLNTDRARICWPSQSDMAVRSRKSQRMPGVDRSVGGLAFSVR